MMQFCHYKRNGAKEVLQEIHECLFIVSRRLFRFQMLKRGKTCDIKLTCKIKI
jgi:hypothetical protein